ncbi:MAG: hypothetical protein EBZ77_17115, partial [Chitinophagia bacterium]|nr:hypothetical protein [Chitinophagia bacterium]
MQKFQYKSINDTTIQKQEQNVSNMLAELKERLRIRRLNNPSLKGDSDDDENEPKNSKNNDHDTNASIDEKERALEAFFDDNDDDDDNNTNDEDESKWNASLEHNNNIVHQKHSPRTTSTSTSTTSTRGILRNAKSRTGHVRRLMNGRLQTEIQPFTPPNRESENEVDVESVVQKAVRFNTMFTELARRQPPNDTQHGIDDRIEWSEWKSARTPPHNTTSITMSYRNADDNDADADDDDADRENVQHTKYQKQLIGENTTPKLPEEQSNHKIVDEHNDIANKDAKHFEVQIQGQQNDVHDKNENEEEDDDDDDD